MESTYDRITMLREKAQPLLPAVLMLSLLFVWLLASANSVRELLLPYVANTAYLFITFLNESSILEVPTVILFGLAIPVFVLTVTFLGRAAKIAKNLQDSEEKANVEEYASQIADLKQKLEVSPNDTANFKAKLFEIENLKRASGRKINNINRKYEALALKDAVLIPCFAFLVSLFFQKLLHFNLGIRTLAICGLIAVIAFIYGLYKMVLTLLVAQEIAAHSDEDDTARLRAVVADALVADHASSKPLSAEVVDALKATISAIDQEKQPKPYIVFDKGLPIHLKSGTESEIAFTVDLADTGNIEARNAEVMIMVPSELELIADPAYQVFKQRMGYELPNAPSALYRFAKLKKHTYCAAKLKIKATKPGKYSFRYKIECDGYDEKAKASEIIVE